jgi:acyl carrier protein
VAKDIVSEVKRVIVEQLDVDAASIKPESNIIDDLGADSLAIVELVLKLEETFGISIPEDETEKIRTVGNVIDYISKHAVAA